MNTKSVISTLLGFAGSALVTKGYLTADQATVVVTETSILIGAAVALVGFAIDFFGHNKH